MPMTVNVLIIVDVEAALATNNLAAHTYMVDTTKYAGSGFEGTSELMTSLAIGDTVVWTVVPVDPGTTVKIHSFSGQAITDKSITPVQDPLAPTSFESKFQPAGGSPPGTTIQYMVSLSLEGTVVPFDPFLVVAKST